MKPSGTSPKNTTPKERESRLAMYIQQMVDAAPPLDAATRDCIAVLFRPEVASK